MASPYTPLPEPQTRSALGLLALGAGLLVAAALLSSSTPASTALFQAPLARPAAMTRAPMVGGQAPSWVAPTQARSTTQLEAAPVITGTLEEVDGGMEETWGFDLGAPNGNLVTQSLKYPKGTRLMPFCMPLPLGMVLEGRLVGDKQYEVYVESLVEGGNAAKNGIQVGDVMRASTAVFQVKGQLDELSYFSNPPKNSYLPGVYVADNKPFDKTMGALQSNTVQVDTPDGRKRDVEEVCLIMQRAVE